MKLIRELRMGSSKQYKTGAVVSTYPKPLLVLEFDQEGLDIIKEPIIPVKPEEIESLCKKTKEELGNKIYALDFCDTQVKVMTEIYQPAGAEKPFKQFVSTVNTLVKTPGNGASPWATVVLDSISGLSDTILAHVASTSNSSLASALKWAPMIGQKLHQCMGVMTGLPCHVVFICHSTSPATNETTQEVTIVPIVPSQWMRDRIGSLVSQFFYQIIEGKVAKVFTRNQGYVKGIGCRWPDGLEDKVGADFNSIYGKVLGVTK